MVVRQGMKGESVYKKNNKFSFISKEAIGLMACLLFVSMLFIFRVVIINRYVMGLLGLITFIAACRVMWFISGAKRNGFLIWFLIVILNSSYIVVMSFAGLLEAFPCGYEKRGTEKQDGYIIDVYETSCGGFSSSDDHIVVRKVLVPYIIYIRTIYSSNDNIDFTSNGLIRKVIPHKNYSLLGDSLRIDGSAIGAKDKDYIVKFK